MARMKFVAAVLTSVALVSSAGCSAAVSESAGGDKVQSRAVSFRELEAGMLSGVTAPEERMVRDAEAWGRLWQAVQAGGSSERPLPAVDFSRETCIAIFAGQRPTGGYAVRVDQVTDSGGSLEVAYRVTAPAPGSIVSQALTSPYQIIAVPSRSGSVRFRRLPER